MSWRTWRSRSAALGLVLLTVLASVAAALALRAVSRGDYGIFGLAFAIGAAAGINLFRVVLWRIIHGRYPITYSYPFTAIFFPIIAVISHFTDAPVSMTSWAGVAIIMAGVTLLSLRSSERART